MPNATEIECGLLDNDHDEHRGVLKDYAFPGSSTIISWMESDRRTFRGPWTNCFRTAGCTLPGDHHGRCAL